MKVSVFKNTWDTVPVATSGIRRIFLKIQTDEKIKSQVELVRSLRAGGDPQHKEEKKKLPAITWSGVFEERLAAKLSDYSGLLCVDIDHLKAPQMAEMKDLFIDDKYILGFFVSPSGDGLKVLLYSSECSAQFHQQFYFTAEKYFKDNYSVDIDRACKDVCRLCYISHDPDAVVKAEVDNFPIDYEIKKEQFFIKKNYSNPHDASFTPDVERCFRVARKWVERIFMYEDGQKNKYIHNLACSLNRLGIPLDKTIELIDNNYVTPDRKWVQSIGSAYKHNAKEFGNETLKTFDPNGEEAKPYIEKEFQFGDVERDIRRMVKKMMDKGMDTAILKWATELYVLVYRNFFDNDIINEVGMAAIVDDLIENAKEEYETNELVNITPISSSSLYDAGMRIKETLNQVSEFETGVDGYDDLIPGLFCRGNTIGVVGREKTYKSVTVHNMAYKNAVKGLGGLYINAEMSEGQFIKRTVKIDSGTDFDYYFSKKEKIPDDVYDKAMNNLKESVGDKLQVHSGKDVTRKGIADLIKLKRSQGFDISYVIVDGLTQLKDVKNDEIKSAIHNAGELKELAKEANVLVIVLVHMRSGVDKTVRDTGEYVRGGNKVTANFDAYFSTSLFEIPSNDESNKNYYNGVFCLRLNDKRGALDVISKVVEVNKDLRLKVSEKEVKDYEL